MISTIRSVPDGLSVWGRVDDDGEFALFCDLELATERPFFVVGHLIETDLADADDGVALEVLRNPVDDLLGHLAVVRFLRLEPDRHVVVHPGGPLGAVGLVLDDLLEVVEKAPAWCLSWPLQNAGSIQHSIPARRARR